MNLNKISVRYAKAIFLLAKEKDILEELYLDFNIVRESIQNVPEFTEIISSPVVSSVDKKEVLRNVFEKVVNELTMRFIFFIIEKNRESYILDIARNFETQYRKEKNIKQVIVTTHQDITSKAEARISEIVKDAYKSNVEIKNKIMSDMIGGIIIRIDNEQLDLSVKTQLQEIKKKLASKSYQKLI